jgi:hypothetical protein
MIVVNTLKGACLKVKRVLACIMAESLQAR